MSDEEVIKRYLQWKKQASNIACIFAAMIARDPAAYGIRTKVLRGGRDISDLQALVSTTDEQVRKAVNDENVEGLSILFPDLADSSLIVQFCHELGDMDAWSYDRSLYRGVDEDCSLISLRAYVGEDLLHDGSEVYSEVLGLGPFESLPPTRRSPITAFELRTNPRDSLPPKSPHSERRANLDKIDMSEMLRDEQIDTTWKRTKQKRLSVLGFDDARAKAQVTFAVPKSLGFER